MAILANLSKEYKIFSISMRISSVSIFIAPAFLKYLIHFQRLIDLLKESLAILSHVSKNGMNIEHYACLSLAHQTSNKVEWKKTEKYQTNK